MESNTSSVPPTNKSPNFTTGGSDSSRTSTLRELFLTLGVVALAISIAFALIAFVFQSYQVDGPSMQNALHNNDRLIVWKTPRTWARLTGHQYVPGRGDVIIFTESGLSSYGQEDSKQLVKRVIGLPGDRVVVKNGAITIYNKEHLAGFKPDSTLPYGDNNSIPFTTGNIDIVLGDNELYVCGDNRSNSLDSRIFGPIHTDQVIGKLVARIYPFSDIEKF
jgi:signal peptidase I